MNRRFVTPVSNPREDEVRHLEDELYKARRLVIELMPADLASAFKSYRDCETWSAAQKWEEEIVERILEHANVEDGYSSPRAYCPLCKGGSQGFYESAFTFPEGLRRHLTGYANARHCPVTKIVFSMASDHWKPLREQDRAQKAAAYEVRLQTEIRYKLSPYEEPELLGGWNSRTEEDMAWADDRLRSLGFAITVDGRIKSYTYDAGDVIVYADPRDKGRIDFRAYQKPLLTRPRRNSKGMRSTKRFHLLDGWKNNLRGRFNAALGDSGSMQE